MAQSFINASVSRDSQGSLFEGCPGWYRQVFEDLVPKVYRAQIQQFAGPETHKMPREYLKTVGAITGRDTSVEGIFDNLSYDPDPEVRNKIPRVTAIIGAWLIREHQRCGDEWLVIDNLSETARLFNTDPRRLKTHLILLGGYHYTTVKVVRAEGRKHGTLEISPGHLFDITFGIDLKPGETFESIPQTLMVGTAYTAFVKDRDVSYVKVRPAQAFRDDLESDRPNFIRVVDDMIRIFLTLDDMTFKLTCFAISNKPTWEITVSKLAEDRFLDLTPQIGQQGYPRVLRQIERALQRLLEVGLFTTATCEPIPGKKDHKLTWEYSTDMVLFKDRRKGKSA